MTARRWVGRAGSFTEGSKWSPTGVPGSNDTALLGAGASVTVPSGTTLGATIELTDPTASLTIQGAAFAASTAVTLEAVNGGGSLVGIGSSSLNGGVLLVGSPNSASPFVIQDMGNQNRDEFDVNATVDVVGAVSVTSPNTSTGDVGFLHGSVNVEPGGRLAISGTTSQGPFNIVGGTLDLTQASYGVEITTFAGSSGTLVVSGTGGDHNVSNFRAGDVIDVKGVSISGTLSPTFETEPTFINGGYFVGGALFNFIGPSAVGATYTATPGGTGGTFVTVSGPAAGRAAAGQYIFGFAFSAASVAFGKDGRALLTAPNGTVTDVTGVATLQFLDGTISTRVGTPVDPLFYYARNPDVWAAHVATGLTAQQHYDQYGWREGRDPDALFSTRAYLAANPDVAAAGISTAQHYDQYGWREGRDTGVAFSPEAYRAANPDVAATGSDPLVQFLEYGAGEGRFAFPGLNARTIGDFDPQFYLQHNPDVAAATPAGLSSASFAFQHFLAYGWHEGRDPDALFSTSFYLQHNPDVARAGVDPLLQFEQFGWHEGRNPGPGFSTAGYLGHNPDVARAGVDPLQHYLQYGMAEGRVPG